MISIISSALLGYPETRSLSRGVLDNWVTQDGLPQNSVSTIVEDQRGFLWLGTEEGLVRFDGRNFKVYDQHFFKDIHNLYIISIILNGEDLWIQFQDYGIIQLNLKTMTYQRHILPGKRQEIRSINSGKDGRIWVGNFKQLCVINSTKNRCVSTEKYYINGLQEGPAKKIWFHHREDTVYSFDGKKIVSEITLKKGTIIVSLLVDHSGGVWIGTRNRGLFYHKKGVMKSILPDIFRHHMINCIYQDKQQQIWVSLQNNGVYRLERDTHLVLNRSFLKIPFVISLTEDHIGNLWMGSKSHGLFRLHAAPFRTYQPKNKGENWVGLSVFETPQKELYLGSSQGGLFKLEDGVMKQVYNHQGDPIKGTITSIEKDGAGGIYVGTFKQGILHIKRDGVTERLNVFKRDTTISVIYLDRSKRVWIGTLNYGVFYLDQKGVLHHVTQKRPDIRSISTITEDHRGQIWFGGQQGLYCYDHYQGLFEQCYPKIKGKIFSIKERENVFYIATNSGFWIVKNNKLFQINTQHGLPVDKIFDIELDDTGRIWFSCNKGIFSIEHDVIELFLKDKKDVVVIRYDQKDGLYSTEGIGGTQHNVYRTQDGDIWFSMLKGIARINPKRLDQQVIVPKITLSQIILDGVITPIKDQELIIPPGVRKIEIHYYGSTYQFPKKVQFRYRLNGVDRNWIEGNRNEVIHYNTLPSGKYLFDLEITDSRGEWHRGISGMIFQVETPFYQMIWFNIIAILGTLLLLFLIIKWRFYLVQKENHKLERLVQVRTEEIQAHLKRIEELSLKDPLTGLLNRRFISDVLKPQLSAFVNQCKYLRFNDLVRKNHKANLVYGVYLIDIDHFKHVNDQYGHDVGDAVLKQFAAILRGAVREDDIVIRWGGEEFLVLLRETSQNYLRRFAISIKEKVSAYVFETGLNGTTIRKNCSIGYVQFPFVAKHPEQVTLEQVIRLADLGLYYSKKNGRNMTIHITETENVPQKKEYYQEIIDLEQSIEDGFVHLEIN